MKRTLLFLFLFISSVTLSFAYPDTYVERGKVSVCVGQFNNVADLVISNAADCDMYVVVKVNCLIDDGNGASHSVLVVEKRMSVKPGQTTIKNIKLPAKGFWAYPELVRVSR